MAKRELDKIRTVYYCSSSIANFREKLHKRLGLEVWQYWKNRNDRVIFFGLYHWKDYLRFIWHRGPKKVFWCGSDILNLRDGYSGWWWKYIIPRIKAKHYCENGVENATLHMLGISAEIRPMIFDDPNKYQISYKHSDNPKVFASYHKGREKEYMGGGDSRIEYLNGYSEEQFNEKIKDYQGCVRLNKFDGFAETLAKSVLMGQYQWSAIPYEHMSFPFMDCGNHLRSLENWLEELKNKKEPNYEGRAYWLKVLEDNLKEIKENW